MIENTIKLFTIFLLTAVLFAGSAFAQDMDERVKLLAEAQEPFLKGEYENAIKIFDEILEIYPTDSKIFFSAAANKFSLYSLCVCSSVSWANAKFVKSTAVKRKIVNNPIIFLIIFCFIMTF